MNCVVVTPDKLVVDKEAVFIALPLYDGECGILQGHSPLIGRLSAGELRIKTPDGKTDSFFVEGGFVEVLDDTITLLTGWAVPLSELDAVEIQQEMDEIRAKPASTLKMLDLKEQNLASYRTQLRLARRSK